MPSTPKLRAVSISAALPLLAACLLGAAAPVLADVPETILHTFADDNSDGETPFGGLVQAADGSFYGTTVNGGTAGDGTVFQISPAGAFAVLHNFDDGSVASDGLRPYDALTIGSDGNLYGTTLDGGASSDGTVFKMTPSGAVTILHSFAGDGDGANPVGGVTFGTDGMLYGVTSTSDPGSAADDGTVYSLSTSGSDYLVQFRFNDDNSAMVGDQPVSALVPVPGSAINQFYGTCYQGGAGDEGTVFKFTPGTSDGGGMVYVMHAFDDGSVANDGQRPYLGGLQTDSSGNLYGTTSQGGAYNYGVVYKLTTSSAETLLHTFGTGSDGQYPFSGLVHASDGNYYGTTEAGGAENQGTVYRIAPSGSNFDTIYNFGAPIDGSDGAYPVATLLEDSDGNILGTTPFGGTYGGVSADGVAYKLMTGLANPVKLSSLSLSPTSVVGGLANSKGTVSLKKPAPSSGAIVMLQSTNPSAASVPSSVTIPANQTTASFTVTSHGVAGNSSVKITASYNGSSSSQSLTVTPGTGSSLSSVTLASSSVAGGVALSGNRIYLAGSAKANTKVSLSSSNTAVATVPAHETILSGSTSHSFTITTSTVTAATTVTITASYGGVTKTATLTVLPSLASVTPAAGSVKGGTSLTGNRITFTGAVNADTTVTLTSSDTSVATVPSSETILAGSSSHSFTITTYSVTATKTVTITAASGGVTQTATLTVMP